MNLRTIRLGNIRNIASANLTSKVVADVYSESASASTGEAAVRIIIVVNPDVAEKLKGDTLLNTLSISNQHLAKAVTNDCRLLSTLLAKSWAMAIISNPEHLFEQAEQLAKKNPLKPRQADLRRSMSSVYYGLFHFILTQAADNFIGSTNRSTKEYLLCFRSVDHAPLRELCTEASKETPSKKVAPLISGGKFESKCGRSQLIWYNYRKSGSWLTMMFRPQFTERM